LVGDERLLVIGDDAERRDFIAGLLYLTGQRHVSVLNVRVSGRAAFSEGRGLPRSKIREQVYRAAMRDRRLVLRSELQRMIASDSPPVLLDGRSEDEYWGVRIRAARGGHLPGAQNLASGSLKRMRRDALAFSDAALVAYGGDAFEGLAYLARLVALGVDASLYLEGWSGWASDGSLPADSLSFSRHERS
jgi:thiosulfate/3-mercaptopyruvate sulfurtransferase